jgi:hypothetical protein
MRAMNWLVMDARPHDSLFFHCMFDYLNLDQQAFTSRVDSGHGGQTPDLDGDEEDGFDEGISQPSHVNFLFTRNAFASHLPCRFQEGRAHR